MLRRLGDLLRLPRHLSDGNPFNTCFVSKSVARAAGNCSDKALSGCRSHGEEGYRQVHGFPGRCAHAGCKSAHQHQHEQHHSSSSSKVEEEAFSVAGSRAIGPICVLDQQGAHALQQTAKGPFCTTSRSMHSHQGQNLACRHYVAHHRDRQQTHRLLHDGMRSFRGAACAAQTRSSLRAVACPICGVRGCLEGSQAAQHDSASYASCCSSSEGPANAAKPAHGQRMWQTVTLLTGSVRGFASSAAGPAQQSAAPEAAPASAPASAPAQPAFVPPGRVNKAPAPPWTPTRELKKRNFLPRRMGHLIQELEKEALEKAAQEKNFPNFEAGDLLELTLGVPENKAREAKVKGICIAKRRRGYRTSFTLLNHVVGGGPVERSFPLYSPTLQGIKILGRRQVRRAKLYYLRSRKPSEYKV